VVVGVVVSVVVSVVEPGSVMTDKGFRHPSRHDIGQWISMYPRRTGSLTMQYPAIRECVGERVIIGSAA